MEYTHKPVLLDACIQALNIHPDGIYVDGTLGRAGHSREIAGRLTTGRLICVDRDQAALEAAGIRAFIVEIISAKVLTPEVLDAVGLAPELDLINPGDYKESLNELGFPTEEAVLNQTAVSFDISPFMPLIPILGTGDSDFKLTVTDNEGQTIVASIMVHSTNGDDPEPEGPEQEYPGGEAKPLEPPRVEQPYPGGDAKPLNPAQKTTQIN